MFRQTWGSNYVQKSLTCGFLRQIKKKQEENNGRPLPYRYFQHFWETKCFTFEINRWLFCCFPSKIVNGESPSVISLLTISISAQLTGIHIVILRQRISCLTLISTLNQRPDPVIPSPSFIDFVGLTSSVFTYLYFGKQLTSNKFTHSALPLPPPLPITLPITHSPLPLPFTSNQP